MNPKYANAAPIPATPEQQRKRDALVYWLVTGIEPEDAGRHVDMFDMLDWRQYRECGTACCMAGAVVHWWGNALFNYPGSAAEHLGLDSTAARLLNLWYAPKPRVDRLHAASVFQNYCETGVVDWEGME